MNLKTCPKCGYQRQAADLNVHADVCPGCGIVYSKWLARQATSSAGATSPQAAEATEATNNEALVLEQTISLKQQLKAAFSYVPEQVPSEAYWARLITLIAFALWGSFFITAGVNWEKLGGSFMHNINLPFHEFGHILFMPFGRFMTILGGSLFQVLLPLILMGVFVFKQRDTFAASLMLWWCGQSFIDLSPYIDDAQYRALPLVGGGGEESHDWGNLLTMMNLLPQTHSIAKSCFLLGAIILIGGLLWGANILRQQKRNCLNFRN